jgi:hypothetical protein
MTAVGGSRSLLAAGAGYDLISGSTHAGAAYGAPHANDRVGRAQYDPAVRKLRQVSGARVSRARVDRSPGRVAARSMAGVDAHGGTA